MQFEHLGAQPRSHPGAVVAPTAVISGDVTIGAGCQVLHGAVLTAEGGPITLGEHVIVMENALIRASAANPVHIGSHVLVGPTASLSGATVGDEVFLATGTRVFNGARIGERSEVRIGAIVHLRTVLLPESVVPIDLAWTPCRWATRYSTSRLRRAAISSSRSLTSMTRRSSASRSAISFFSTSLRKTSSSSTVVRSRWMS